MRAFISYSHKDKPLANTINDLLMQRGVETFIDQGKIGAGDVLTTRIKNELDRTDLFVILFTKHPSDWRDKEEFKYIWPKISEGKVRFLPFVFPGAFIPPELEQNKYLLGKCRSEDSMTDISAVINFGLKKADYRIPMSRRVLQKRLTQRKVPEYGLRLIPTDQFNENGTLGLKERKYVFIGDYLEQCGRTLRVIKTNLFSSFIDWTPAVEKWTAIIFKIDELYAKQYDLFPGTWKSIFRILSNKKRLGIINASEEDNELIKNGSRKYDYYGDDDHFFWSIKKSLESNQDGDREFYSYMEDYFGLRSTCFNGNGVGGDGVSRIFLIKNLAINELSYWVQDLGDADGTPLK